MVQMPGSFDRLRVRRQPRTTPIVASSFQRYVGAALVVASATALMLLARSSLDALNVGLIFLLIAFALGLVVGSGPAALAALLSFFALDFYFIPPFHGLSVAQTDHLLALVVYLGVAVVTAQLVARMRARTELAELEQRRTALLFDLNAALIGNMTLDTILANIVERVVRVYGSRQCRILLPAETGSLIVHERYPVEAPAGIDRQDLAVATWVMEHRAPASQRSNQARVRLPHGTVMNAVPNQPRWPRRPGVLYVPIATAERTIGVLEVTGRPGGSRIGDDDEQLLISFANQAALALDRARLTEEAARVAALAQSDEMKSALLAAVSHDLRTPLATIKASATSLLDRSVEWDESARSIFLNAIDQETDRLTSMVANLLDLSRIEGGALRPNGQWYDAAELIRDVGNRLTRLGPSYHIVLDIAPDLPLARFDYLQMAQVLMNLGENALKYTPGGTTIMLGARRRAETIEFFVHDSGPGIAPRDAEHVFEKFYRGGGTARASGSGIGLAICKGIVEAHGGSIWLDRATRDEDRAGTTFRLTIPLTVANMDAA
ncbi:MAG TPA: ATP-binding protein [Thermomicrobiales bacterium]|nr:ATP-binding protein [Thermomicrobiales bacterium]